MYKVLFAAPLLACLVGCETIESMGTREAIGTTIGGIAGGVVGNRASGNNKVIWTAVGVAAGAFIGNQIGKYLDDRDKEQVAQATVVAADTGEPQEWSNPESGLSGQTKVVANKSGNADGECRDIEQSVTLADGSVKTDTVTACKGPDGWAVV